MKPTSLLRSSQCISAGQSLTDLQRHIQGFLMNSRCFQPGIASLQSSFEFYQYVNPRTKVNP